MDYGNCLLFFLVVDPSIRMYLYGLMMDGHVIIIHTHLHTPLRQHHHPLTHRHTTPYIPHPSPPLFPPPFPPSPHPTTSHNHTPHSYKLSHVKLTCYNCRMVIHRLCRRHLSLTNRYLQQ